MQQLIFLSDEFQLKSTQESTNIPLNPLSPAFVYAKMYRMGRKRFLLPSGTNKKMGSRVVYGTLYSINDFEHWSRALDALHDCSKSLLKRNHIKDMQHRVRGNCTLIRFDSIEDFLIGRVYEVGTFEVQMYLGNINHPKIKQKISHKKHSYRVPSGTHAGFLEQWED